jgi:hypothetical protein
MWIQILAPLLTECDLESGLTMPQPWALIFLSVEVGYCCLPESIVAKCGLCTCDSAKALVLFEVW